MPSKLPMFEAAAPAAASILGAGQLPGEGSVPHHFATSEREGEALDKTTPVRRLVEGFRTLDLDLVMAQLAEGAVFENIPMDLIVGKPAIRESLGAFMAIVARAPWVLRNIAVSDSGTVMTERDDQFELKDGRRVHTLVMGAFDVNAEGLITHWRDYFDLSDWNRGMGLEPDFGRRAR